MPVDLSTVGLDGIAAGQKTLDQIDVRKTSALLRQSKEIEMQQDQRELDVIQSATQKLNDNAAGKTSQSNKMFEGTDSESASMPLFIMAKSFMEAGLPKQAATYFKSAMDIKKQASDIEKDKVTNSGNKLENIIKTANAFSSALGSAKNNSEWQWGLSKLEGSIPDEQLQVLKDMDFSDPEKAEKLKDITALINEHAMTAVQRATLDAQASNMQMAQAAKREGFEIARIGLGYQAERLAIAQAAEARQGKVGISASAPNSNELAGAEAFVKNTVFKGVVPKGQEAAYKQGAQAIAARAKEMVTQDKSLNWDTAINRAGIESQVNGDWETTTEENWFSPNETTVTYGMGKTPDMALPLPLNKDGKPDVTQYKKNKYYITGGGKALWDGVGFIKQK